jgi:hypothetical protein
MLDLSIRPTRSRFRAAILIAVIADAVQLIGYYLFAEGAISPADDVLDLGVAVALTAVVGWHWEFAPSLLAELVPGLDLVPSWTLAAINVYRKWKQTPHVGDTIDVVPLK